MSANVKGVSIVPKETLAAILPRLQEEKTKAFSGLIFTLITIAIFAVFAISPTLATIADLQKQLDDSTFVNNQLQTKINNLSSLQQQYNTLSPDLPIIMQAIPSSANIPYFFGQLQTLATETNVDLSRIQSYPVDISSTLVSPPYQSFAYNIDATGTTNQINSLLAKLSTLNRLTTIDSLSITKSDPLDTVRFSMKGSVFFKQL